MNLFKSKKKRNRYLQKYHIHEYAPPGSEWGRNIIKLASHVQMRALVYIHPKIHPGRRPQFCWAETVFPFLLSVLPISLFHPVPWLFAIICVHGELCTVSLNWQWLCTVGDNTSLRVCVYKLSVGKPECKMSFSFQKFNYWLLLTYVLLIITGR